MLALDVATRGAAVSFHAQQPLQNITTREIRHHTKETLHTLVSHFFVFFTDMNTGEPWEFPNATDWQRVVRTTCCLSSGPCH